MRAILREPAYRASAPTTAQRRLDLFGALWDRYTEWSRPFWQWLDRFLHSNGTGGTIVGYAIAFAALAALSWLAYRIVRAAVAPRGPRAAPVASFALGLAQRDSAAWHLLAGQRAASGDYAGAIAALFAAALALLDARDVVPFDPTRTAGEYRRAVSRARASASLAFDALAACFVRAAFGPARPTAQDYAAASGAWRALEPHLG